MDVMREGSSGAIDKKKRRDRGGVRVISLKGSQGRNLKKSNNVSGETRGARGKGSGERKRAMEN